MAKPATTEQIAIPEALAARMAQLASHSDYISPKARILASSPGDGAIVKALASSYPTVTSIDCLEEDPENRVKLKSIGEVDVRLMGEHIIDVINLEEADYVGQYDIVIACPPFTKNQDIDHIRAMYQACKTNGRIVTLASTSWVAGSQKKQKEFREWLTSIGAFQEEIPAGTFAESGTGVGAMLLVIDKLEATAPVAVPDPAAIEKYVDIAENLLNIAINSSNIKRITIPTSPLMSVLKKVKEVVSKHPTIAVLSNILIKVRRTDIIIIATDLMVTIQATIEVDNIGDYGYEYLLPFNFLYDICNLINDMDLTIEITTSSKMEDDELVEKQHATITTYTDTFNQDDLKSTIDWPVMPEFPQENSVGIGGDFIEWLNKAITTASVDNLRPAMQKIYIQVTNEGIVMASTTGHVVFEKTFDSESVNTTELLVNTKIAKALKGFKETSISWSHTHIAFVSNGITMIGTIQGETFPDYKRIFPAETPGNLKLSLTELTGIMEKAALTNRPATIYLKREIGFIVVDSYDEMYNRKVQVRIAADYSGNCDQIMVNPENMLLLLKQIEYVTVTLSITGHDRAIIITSESDPSYRALTMPLIN